MFKRAAQFLKRLLTSVEEHPATPYLIPATGQWEDTQQEIRSRTESTALFQDVMDIIDNSGRSISASSSDSIYAPTIPEKYPFFDDCFYVMVIESCKTTRILGIPIKRTTRECWNLSPDFQCPHGTTDPLHWTHGPDDPHCRRTNEATVWCCSTAHMYHVRDNCRRNLPNPVQCTHGCIYGKVINKQNAFLQDRHQHSVRAPIHTPVPWNASGSLTPTVNSTAASTSSAADRQVVFPIPDPNGDVSGRYVSLPVKGSHLLYEIDTTPSTPYPACASELRPTSRSTSASNGAHPSPPECNTGTPAHINDVDNVLPRSLGTLDIPSLALNVDSAASESHDEDLTAFYHAM